MTQETIDGNKAVFVISDRQAARNRMLLFYQFVFDGDDEFIKYRQHQREEKRKDKKK